TLDGESLLPFCRPGAPPQNGPEIAYFETMGPVSFDWSPLDGVTTLEWKYIRGPTDELYYLPSDPDELDPLEEEKPEVVARLQKAADSYAAISSKTGETCEMAGRQSELFGAIGYLSLDAKARRPSKDAPHPKDMVTVLDILYQAQGAYVMQRYGQALPFYEQCVLLSPGTAMFHDFLGKTKRRLGDDPGAVKSFRNALSINPDMIDLRLLLGINLQNLNDLAGAEKELREVIRRAPELRKGYGYLASLLHEQNRLAEELEVIDLLLKNVTFDDQKDMKVFIEQRKVLKKALRR
ncbi:MAG: tetratricopeptide repeat protein, partial [Planctomycetes bacterium]|nr:tetratricopeptide repeat protein [Planctomycetota bacterium]